MGSAVFALGACAEPSDPCAGLPPARTVVAERLEDPLVNDLAVDTESVYWIDFRADLVRRASKGGGGGQTIAQTYSPQRVAIDDENVYWVGGRGGVSKASKTGGAVTVISPDSDCSIRFPCGDAIAVDADAVYWVADGHLMSWSKQGGQPVELSAPGLYTGDLVVDSGGVYWRAVDLIDGIVHSVVRVTPKSGGEVQTLAILPEGDNVGPMAGDAANVYVARRDGVWRMPKDMSDAVLIAAGPVSPRGITTDGVNVYIAESDRILRVPASGGELVPIACEQMAALQVVVDDSDAYWNAEHVNAILSAPK